SGSTRAAEAQMSDATMAELQQVPGGEPGAAHVVQRRGGQRGRTIVEQDGRDARARGLDDLAVGRGASTLPQQPVHRPALDCPPERHVTAGQSVDVGEQQYVRSEERRVGKEWRARWARVEGTQSKIRDAA